jgi:hypothetical protein
MIHADMPNDTAPNPRRKLTMRANLHSTTRAPRRGVTFLTMRPQNDAGDKQREKQTKYGYLQIVVHFGGSGRGIQWVGFQLLFKWPTYGKYQQLLAKLQYPTNTLNLMSGVGSRIIRLPSFGAVSIGCHSIIPSSSCVSQIPDRLMATPHRPAFPLRDDDALIAADALCGPCGSEALRERPSEIKALAICKAAVSVTENG